MMAFCRRWRWAAAAAAVLLVAMQVAAVMAQPTLRAGDYGLENRDWNGLSEFVRMAKSMGYEVEPRSGLDLGALGPEDRVIVIYPTADVDQRQLARFIIDGGRAIVADDFGASEPLLERLGIDRESLAPRHHSRFFLGRPSLPLFKPGGKHPLLDGVDEVVANHPSVLRTEGGAILPFDDGQSGLVYDMRLGRGKAIVMGDASLMINHMIDVRDNRRFLENTLDYLCLRADPCRPYLLVGDAALTGTYKPQNSRDDDIDDVLSESFEALNSFFEDMTTYVPHRNAVYYASLLLMVGLVVFMVTVFSWRRVPAVAPDVGPPPHVRSLSEFEWNLLRYDGRGFQANYALPMSILKTEFERLFFARLAGSEEIPPPENARRAAFLRRMAQGYIETYQNDLSGRARARTYKQTHQLLRLFSRIPPRDRLFLDSEAFFSERELMKVYARSRAILDTMGAGEEYERRTRRIGRRSAKGDRPFGA